MTLNGEAMTQDQDPITDPQIETGDGAPGDGAAPVIPPDGHYADVRPLLFGDLWDYAPAPESPDHVRFEKIYGHFIVEKKPDRHVEHARQVE